MIWVIGDIHGMFDALKMLLTAIRYSHSEKNPVEKIIFLGNYIDIGPSSKEILDYLPKIEFKTVFLAGNHEDLCLRFLRKEGLDFQSDPNLWFRLGGVDTWDSILSQRDKASLISSLQAARFKITKPGEIQPQWLENPDLVFPEKYMRFLNKLKYSHIETFDCGERELKVTFLHSLPRWDQKLKSQRNRNFSHFNQYLSKTGKFYPLDEPASSQFLKNPQNTGWIDKVPLERSFLWERVYDYRCGYGGELVVHGHTPTIHHQKFYLSRINHNLMPDFAEQFKTYSSKSALPFLFSRGAGARYHYDGRTVEEEENNLQSILRNGAKYYYDPGKNGGVEAINIDTGAVHGGALTAIGLSGPTLSEGILNIFTAFTSVSKRLTKLPIFRTLHAGKFGNP